MTCRRPLEKGEHLFRQGEEFTNIYAIRSGTVQSYLHTDKKAEQITGFHLPGELLGLNAIAGGKHLSNCKTLERCSVCEISFEAFAELGEKSPALQPPLLLIMSKEMAHSYQFIHFFGKRSAKSRLVIFLLNLSTRFKLRGFSARQFNLGMRRMDIANYIGLNPETITRLFADLQQQGLLELHKRQLHLHDITALEKIANS